MKPQDKILVSIGAISVLCISSFTGYTLFATKDSDVPRTAATTNTTSNSSPTTPQQTSSVAGTPSTYAGGTYSETISYYVPRGVRNGVTVRVTVKDNIVTDVTTNHDYSDRESAYYIDSFDQEIKPSIVGKNLGTASPSRVGGASLTTTAFDDALDTIRNDAKA